jgi:DNA-binding FadR family transcriptional regulator
VHLQPAPEPADGDAIPRTSLVGEIAARLKRDILEGRHRPGEALPPERELSARYGVTRTSLKHALVRLEQLGLIRIQHGVGSIVQDVQQSGGADLLRHLAETEDGAPARFLREILEARSLVAGGFARLAAARREPDDLDALERLLGEIGVHRRDAREVQRLENAFFRGLARASKNRAFVFLTNSVSAAYKVHSGTYLEPYRDGAWVEAALGAILAALRARDATQARAATERYFDENARRVLASLRRGRKER